MSAGGSVGGVVKPLSHDAVFRIEVSLSSRRSSAIVMRTTARLYSLEGTQGLQGGPGDAEWKSVAYGAPCIQLTKETTEHNSPFSIKIVIAEVESGISLWEERVDASSGYHVMQNNFHTFKNRGKTYAIQFASEEEASRMLESLEDLLLQKVKAETVSFDTKPEDPVFKKPKPFSRRLSKKDISAPCNFKHVSGITLQRTQTCEEELRGSIQRKTRSMSMSSLPQKKRPPIPGEMMNGYAADRQSPRQSPNIPRKEKGKEAEVKRSSSMMQKFGSLRKKKGSKHGGGVTVTVLDHPPDSEDAFARDEHRRSLPSHFRHKTRPSLAADTFVHPEQEVPNGPNRGLSLSSGDLVDLPETAPAKTRQAAPLERRHTVNEHMGRPPLRPFTQYNYTPYSVAQAKAVPEGPQLSDRQFMSDMSLNRMPQGNMPAGRIGQGAGRQPQGNEGVGVWTELPGRGEDSRQVRQGRRISLMEAQLNGRMGWQERGWVEARGSAHLSGRQIARNLARSTGSIHDSTVPPPLPPPNPWSQSGMNAQVSPTYPPQHRHPSGTGIHQPNWPPAQHPTQGGPPLDSTDPQPYATIGFKMKSRAQPKTVPPSEYDVLTPRHPSGAAKRQAYQPQHQNVPPHPQRAQQPSETRVSPPQADSQRYPQDMTRLERPSQYPVTAQAFQQRSPPHILPQTMGAPYYPHPTAGRAPYPNPAFHQQATSPHHQGHMTATGSANLSSPGRHTGHNVSYPGHVTTGLSYPGHVTTGLSSYPGHVTAGLSYPGQATTNVLYSSHMSANMSYPGHMTSNVHRSPVAPPSPSHPSTQVAPAQSAPYSTGQFFQPMPSSSHSPVHHPGRPQSYPNRSQGPVADMVGPQEHYDVLTPRGTLDTGTKATPDGSPASGRGPASGESLQYTEQMSRALEQFDSLLAPQPKKQIMQTSL